MSSTLEETFDLVVIGAGPGGYVAAIRAAQLGLKTACIEKEPALGGTCLNWGCIPSKALLDSSELYHLARTSFAKHGIKTEVSLDLSAMMARKDQVASGLTRGVASLFKKNKVEQVQGNARLISPTAIQVNSAAGARTLNTKRILVATGSEIATLPHIALDGKDIITSNEAISLTEVPKKLLVIGGGAIGLELGSVWSRLGSQVTVVEALPQICPFLDGDVAKAFQKTMEKQGLQFIFEAKVTGAVRQDHEVVLSGTAKDGSAQSWTADRVLVAVGRRPCIDGAGLEGAGVQLTERKRVKVDASFRTNLPGVWAIGDLVDGPMLAHKAEEEGVAVAELIAGQKAHVDHNLIPNVVYTEPEVASIGLTEADCTKRSLTVRVGRFPFLANGRARAAGATDGFVKIIADAKTDRVLGAAIIGQRAADLIAAIAAHMVYGGSSEDIARTCVAHPTHGEAVKEAALDCLGRVIHA